MGGEWWFDILEEPLMSLDLVQYHLKLLEIREAFKSKLKSNRSNNIEVFWCEGIDPLDNVFGQFSYKCSWNPICTTHSVDKVLNWTLYWNPKIVAKENRKSDVNARCSNKELFTANSIDIQKLIIDEFPKGFQLYLTNGIDGCTLNQTNEFYVAKSGFVPSYSSVKTLTRAHIRDIGPGDSQRSIPNADQILEFGNPGVCQGQALLTTTTMESQSTSNPPGSRFRTPTQFYAAFFEENPTVHSASIEVSEKQSLSPSSTTCNRRTTPEAFAEYIASEMQGLSESEQDRFKLHTVDILCQIKQERRRSH